MNPELAKCMYFSTYTNNVEMNVPGKAEMRLAAQSGGYWAKNADGYSFSLAHMFGPITCKVSTSREDTCTKRVVGTETVERVADEDKLQRQIRALRAAARKTTVTVDKTEWDCPSLLSD